MHRLVDTFNEPDVAVEAWEVGFMLPVRNGRPRFTSRLYVTVTAGASPEEVVALSLPDIKADGRDFCTKTGGFKPSDSSWIARKANPQP